MPPFAVKDDLTNSDSETRRINEVYRHYRRDSAFAGKWSSRNPGNRRIVLERARAFQCALARFGYLPLTERRILEVGCGSGAILAGLLEIGAKPEHLVGIDLLEDRVCEARSNFPGISFHQGNAEHMDFPDSSFDIVLFYTVFTSILENRMRENIAREARRILKPGGAIAWYDFRYSNPWNPHVRGIGRREIGVLFPGFQRRLRAITLLPPLARRLGPLTGLLYPCLAALPPLRTHWLGLLIKPSPSPAC